MLRGARSGILDGWNVARAPCQRSKAKRLHGRGLFTSPVDRRGGVASQPALLSRRARRRAYSVSAVAVGLWVEMAENQAIEPWKGCFNVRSDDSGFRLATRGGDLAQGSEGRGSMLRAVPRAVAPGTPGNKSAVAFLALGIPSADHPRDKAVDVVEVRQVRRRVRMVRNPMLPPKGWEAGAVVSRGGRGVPLQVFTQGRPDANC